MKHLAQYQCLSDLGIEIWKERSEVLQLQSIRPVFGVKCWVLLHDFIDNDTEKECLMIFEGMMKVLNLPKKAYHISYLQANFDLAESLDLEELAQALAAWLPKTLLILGSTLGEQWMKHKAGFLNCPCFVTYHPRELWQAPEKKKEAYHTLLNLKKTLEEIAI